MLDELRRLVHQQPFVPFAIHMANGEIIHVPTTDHIAISPTGKRVVGFDDEGVAAILSVLLISHLKLDEAAEHAM